MEQFKDSILRTVQYLLSARVPDIIDILIVAFLIYKLIELIRRTNSNKIAKGILVVLLVLWASDWLNLTVIHFILSKAVEVGLLALIILFQPEIRRTLEKVGSGSILNLLRGNIHVQAMDTAITQTVIACKAMSKNKTGALIVFERVNKLDNQINTGTIIHSDTTAELLKNIFYDKAPLHDGAVIISEGKIAAAACMLPLSSNQNLSRDLGMRHRAGIGMSEHSDAVVAIVSEETGAISIAVDGMLKRHLAPETFEKILRNELIIEEELSSEKKKLSDYFRVKKHG
ncbi:MAG: diadenylate cyclase CdaA [Oscillospiraceae bacterium]|nr:diadenylate cyclase CdaA [Oscillospiraceae bacterium]